nr:uncharacterized protein LOC124807089 [Hydra vulgaris]
MVNYTCYLEKLIEHHNPYIGGIYSIETTDPQYRVDLLPEHGDHARVVINSAEKFYCVEALNGRNDSVSFQSATKINCYLRYENDRLKIQSPFKMCTTYSHYQDDASFVIRNNTFYPGYVSFQRSKSPIDMVESYFFRNDNNTFIFLQPQQDLDSYRRDISFKLERLGVCSYTTWSEWSECSATCHLGDCGNPVKTRQKICQAGKLGGIVYDFQSCNFHVPCPGTLTQWNTWETCSASCKNSVNGPYQYRKRTCNNFFSFYPNYIGCNNSSLIEEQLCNQNVTCTVICSH